MDKNKYEQLVFFVIVITSMISCQRGVHKHPHVDAEQIEQVKNQYQDSTYHWELKEEYQIICDSDTMIIDKESYSRINLMYIFEFNVYNESIYKCIINKAFNGDNSAISTVNDIMDMILKKHGGISYRKKYYSKLRGKLLFEKFLKLADNYECPRDHTSIHSNKFDYYMKFIIPMIKNVEALGDKVYQLGAMTEQEYVEMIDNRSDLSRCEIKAIKSQSEYNALKSLYNQGFIILKDFGED